ncbi:MAG: Hsp20/alpha crystallin family protein [Acidimicrobiia bacterium]
MLMRFDPFRELDRLSQELLSNGNRRTSGGMPMDAYRQGETFYVHFDLPGVDPSSIDLTVEKNVLTVRAERQIDWGGEGSEVLVAERPQGTYSRQLFLGETLDADRISASYDQGVLTLTIPVAEAAKPRRVEVSAGASGGATAINTTAGAATEG